MALGAKQVFKEDVVKEEFIGGVRICTPDSREECSPGSVRDGWDIARATFDQQREDLIRACRSPEALRCAVVLAGGNASLVARLKKAHRELEARLYQGRR